MVKIRLQRGGRTHRPVYTIVAANSRAARDGKFLEKLGQYDPKGETNLKDLKVEAIQAWIGKGAILSDTVKSLLRKHSVKL